MALDNVSATSAASNSQTSRISQEDFLKILLTQLTAQDPLKPMDNTAFVAQLAQFTQLEQTQQLSSSVGELVTLNTATQTLALLGRSVDIVDSGFVSTGQVTEVSVSGTTPTVTVHTASGQDATGVQRSNISAIR